MSIIKQKQETLSDHLPYFGFDPKTQAIWLKDGSATLSLKIVPKDCSQLTDEELERLRIGLTHVLNHLPEDSVLQALMIRERSKCIRNEAYQRWITNHSKDISSDTAKDLLFEAKKTATEQKFNLGMIFQTRCYLTLRVLPAFNPSKNKTIGSFSHLGFWFTQKKTARRTRDQILVDLNSALTALNTGLSSLGFEAIHVSHEERMEVLYEWLNPERSQVLPAPVTNDSTTLSDQIGLTDLVENRSGLSLGRTELGIASLKSLPEFSIPAAMQELACANIPFSMSLTIYVLPQTQERERLLRKQRLAHGMASGNTVRNLLAEAQLRDIEDTLGALISSGEKLFAVSFQMTGSKETV